MTPLTDGQEVYMVDEDGTIYDAGVVTAVYTATINDVGFMASVLGKGVGEPTYDFLFYANGFYNNVNHYMVRLEYIMTHDEYLSEFNREPNINDSDYLCFNFGDDDVTYLYTTMPDGSENTTTIPVDPWRSDPVG